MKLIKTLALLLMSGMLFISCEKEYSEESSGAAGNAAGTLKAAASGECLPSSVKGLYIAGTTVTASNYIDVTVDVTSLGAYSISTDLVNGYTFSATGFATTLGLQTIKLVAAGKPTTEGLNTFTVKFGTSQCNIVVETFPAGTGNAAFTVNCTGAVLAGTYKQGAATTSANTVKLEVVATTAGIYNITTTAVNGVSFSGTGALVIGSQMVTLTASGTPAASGPFSYPVSGGTGSCNFSITYEAGTVTPPVGGLTWSFKVGTTTYSGTTNTSFIETTPVPVLEIIGVNAGGADFSLILTATSGSLGSGTYPGTVTGLGKFSLSFDFSEGSTEYTFMSMLGGNISTTIGTYNTSTKIVEGTFSGTAKTGNDPTGGTLVNIAEGKFKANLP